MSCEAGAAEKRRVLLGSATTRGARGTTRRDPSVTADGAQRKAPSLCPILFCHHTPAARNRLNRPRLLGVRVQDRCRFPYRAAPRIGNQIGHLRGFRRRIGRYRHYRQDFVRAASATVVPRRRSACSSSQGVTSIDPRQPHHGKRQSVSPSADPELQGRPTLRRTVRWADEGRERASRPRLGRQ